MRGNLFYAYPNENNTLVVRAGRRRFVGIAAARAHWNDRHDSDLNFDIATILERIEKIATYRGLKLNDE